MPIGQEEETDDPKDDRVHAAVWLIAQTNLRKTEAKKGPVGRPDLWLAKAFKTALTRHRGEIELEAASYPDATAEELCRWVLEPVAVHHERVQRPLGCDDCTGGFVDHEDRTVSRCPTCHDLPIPSGTLRQ